MQINSDKEKTLIVYFSHTGNTRRIAEQIRDNTGGDLVEIETLDEYPADHNEILEQARKEINTGYRPALKTRIESMSDYTLLFLGYPNWWGTIPTPISAFLEEHDLSGKKIAPFCTHGTGGLARTVEAVRKSCPDSKVLDAMGISNNRVHEAEGEVTEWLSHIHGK
ncbi:MAG: NAD(P)H-dependent oxidoreductase [Deltaproteobacteria bacterium]|nr:NAD(P)H-dependent oxidoreductase [Deltaproteobacteria bacterium]